MAADIAPDLLAKIRRLYKDGTGLHPLLRELRQANVLSYAQAQKYAELTGEEASKALTSILTEDALPDGRLYYNIAERTVRPVLETVQSDVADIAVKAQAGVNAQIGIGLKAVRPELNDDRIVGLIDRLTGAEQISDVQWLLKAPVVNFAQSVVDDSVRVNADFHASVGLHPKLKRYPVAGCCEWCENLTGVYDYYSAPADIYRRHDNCDCVIEYDPGSGKSKNVWGSQVGQLTRKTQKRLERQKREEMLKAAAGR